MSHDRCLLLYTKPARPGRVKTRLIGALTPGQAADLHAAFLGDLLERLSRGRFELRLAWALESGEEAPDLGLPGRAQEGEDLGERLYRGLAAAARSFPLVAAVGSDHPTLPLARVDEAFRRLEAGAEVVLGPAADGGYYLVGARAETLRRRLFEEVPWSTGRVLEATLERCRELGVACELLPGGSDVDTPEDLEALAGDLARRGGTCPRTRRLLAAWGRLPPATPAPGGGAPGLAG